MIFIMTNILKFGQDDNDMILIFKNFVVYDNDFDFDIFEIILICLICLISW